MKGERGEKLDEKKGKEKIRKMEKVKKYQVPNILVFSLRFKINIM